MRASRTPALLLAVLAWTALLLQLWLSIRLSTSQGTSAFHGVVEYFGYFTVLSNLFVALVATAGARRRMRDRPRGLYRAMFVGCATTAIVVVGVGYHLLLRNAWDPQGAQKLADMLLHYAVPIGAVLHWLWYPHTERLHWRAPMAWCLYPIAYFVYALIRGAILHSYPYPFIDVSVIGYGRAALNGLGLMLVFIVIGELVVAISRARHRRLRHL